MTIKYYLDFEIDDKNDPVRTLHTVNVKTRSLRRDLAKIWELFAGDWLEKYSNIKKNLDISFRSKDSEIIITMQERDELQERINYCRSICVEAMRHHFREKLHDTIDYDCDDEILIAQIVKMQVRFKDQFAF